jgi:hypothetical protein
LPYALLHGPAVGTNLAAADVVMAAFVVENEKSHRVRMPAEQARVEHDGARRCQTKIRESRVKQIARSATPKRAASDHQVSIAAHERRCMTGRTV